MDFYRKSKVTKKVHYTWPVRWCLLICTLISENLGLEKSRSYSNLRKISGPANLDFFSVCHLDFFSSL